MNDKNELVEQLKKLRPQTIILFGSSAQGTDTPESDIDVVLIQPTKKPYSQRVRDVHLRLRSTVPADIIVLTPQEAKDLPKTNSFFSKIFKFGKVIYGRI